jgi:DNA-binding GntR family transcriptional regulator
VGWGRRGRECTAEVLAFRYVLQSESIQPRERWSEGERKRYREREREGEIVKVEENYVPQMNFPSVTFCNQNRIR